MKNFKKKSIIASICAASLLLGANPAQAMLGKVVASACIGGLGKKYLYDPLKTMLKYRNFRAEQEVQDLSDEALDNATDQNSLRDRLHTWYLKKFGYNRMYIADPTNQFKPYDENGRGCDAYTIPTGGIFIRDVINKGLIYHENQHLHNGDETRLRKKFRFRFLKIKRKSFGQMEALAEKGTISVLYNADKLYSFVNRMLCNFDRKETNPNCPYAEGAITAFEQIKKENPSDTLLHAIENFHEKKMQYKKIKQRNPKMQPAQSLSWVMEFDRTGEELNFAATLLQNELRRRGEVNATVTTTEYSKDQLAYKEEQL